MKALSIRQPWAWLILHAGKDIENRTWHTKQFGTVLVHASKRMPRDDYDEVVAFLRTVNPTQGKLGKALPAFDAFDRGCLIGTINIVDCTTHSTSPWFFGPHGFVLREPRLFTKPIPYQGKLGFFDVPNEVVAEAMAA